MSVLNYQSMKSPMESEFSDAQDSIVASKHGKRFTKEEDALLKELAKDKKNRTWKEIATFLPGRTACQCRDRYNQYLFKEVVSKPWTSEEDEVIVEKYRLYGPHWVKISQFLPGRSGNNIKNRWNSALTKYHGIQHKNIPQQRRSRKSKWETEESSNSDYQSEQVTIQNSPELDNHSLNNTIIKSMSEQEAFNSVFNELDFSNMEMLTDFSSLMF